MASLNLFQFPPVKSPPPHSLTIKQQKQNESRLTFQIKEEKNHNFYYYKSKVTYVFLDGMGSKHFGKNVEDLFSNPTAFGERREGKVVWADFTETYTKKQNKINQQIETINNESRRH
jgi:hypothetical protein